MPGPFDQGWRRIVVAASGPSFTAEQAAIIERARQDSRCRVIAINTTALTLLPNADALYAADAPWWHHYINDVRAKFRGQLWCSNDAVAKQYRLRFVPSVVQREGLSKDLGKVNRGGNSGYATIGLSYLFGPPASPDDQNCQALVGFDMRNDGRRSHHHGDHPRGLANPTDAALKTWAGRFDALARDLAAANVGVVNCTGPQSALKCFECVPLEEIFAMAEA